MNRQQAREIALSINEMQNALHKIRDSKSKAEADILKHALAREFDLLPAIVEHHENMTVAIRFTHLGIENRWAKLREAGYSVQDKWELVAEAGR